MLIVIIFWIIIACLIFPFANKRGRSGFGWFIFSVVFSTLLGETEERRRERIIEDEKLRQSLRN